MEKLAAALVTPQRLPNPALVGKSARLIAEKIGITVPEGTRALIAPLAGVGRDYPLSIEKLCPVLSWYEVQDWREGCERCIQILRYGGMGHTMSIHSENEDVILQFGLKKPAYRICVNTPTTHGSIGLTTGLDPAMTLGCGGWGGNITSDNISPRHLLNLKRLAWGIRPLVTSAPPKPVSLPKAPSKPSTTAIPVAALSARVDQFLASRGYRAPDAEPRPAVPAAVPAPIAATEPTPVAFVCEDDVRTALKEGRQILIGEKTIITPAARDLGEASRIFREAGWPGTSR
jgi:acetaldehyde dehydrogenase (acetylating)